MELKEPSNFSDYMLKQSRKETAFEKYNYASTNLKNAQIHERLAEIRSQHEPLASLLDKPFSERDRLYAAAFYVVVGRLPSSQERKDADEGQNSKEDNLYTVVDMTNEGEARNEERFRE